MKRKIHFQGMTVEQAVDVLRVFGSDDDPIEVWDPKQEIWICSSPAQIKDGDIVPSAQCAHRSPAFEVTIRFYDDYKKVESNLEGMVASRMGLRIRSRDTGRLYKPAL